MQSSCVVDHQSFFEKKNSVNMQVVCDSFCRFTHVSIFHPGSASDYIAWVTQNSLYNLLESNNNPLRNGGYYIFSNMAYINAMYMITPYKSPTELQDDFNFYHSQVRITIERAFGILVHRWGILRKPLSKSASVQKNIQMVLAMCKLHNAIINYNLERGVTDLTPPPLVTYDDALIRVSGGVELENTPENPLSPEGLLHAGHHNDGRPTNIENRENDEELPREKLFRQVIDSGLERPRKITPTINFVE